MKSHYIRGGRAAVSGMFILGFLLLSGKTLMAQTSPILKLDDIVVPELKISFIFIEERGFLPLELDRSLLAKYRKAEGFSAQTILYDYIEQRLVPAEKEQCTLTLYVLSNESMNQSGNMIDALYKKYSVKVEGNFMDGPVKIPVRFSKSGQESDSAFSSGTITLTAHQKIPNSALEIVPAVRSPIVIRATEDRKIDIALKNKSGCPIHISAVKVIPENNSLWNPEELKTQIIKPEIPFGESDETPAVKLDLKPYWTTFLRKGLMPPNLQDPSRVELIVQYQVENGKAAEARKYFEVSFSPPISMLLITPMVAAAVSFLLVTFFILPFIKPQSASGETRKTGVLLKRAVLGMIVAFFSFLILWAFRDNIELRLFDFSVNPDQLLTPVLIGIIAGTKPKYFLKKIKDFVEGQPGPSPQPAKKPGKNKKIVHHLFLVFSALACSSFAAAGINEPFRPIMLAYHEKSNSVYTVDWGTKGNIGTIYRIDASAAAPKLEVVKRMKAVGDSTDHCLVERGTELWLATVAIETVDGIQQSRVFLIPLLTPEKSPEIIVPKEKMIKRGVGQCWAITYDRPRDRLLLTDPVRRAVFEVKIEDNGLGKSGPIIKDPSFNRPTAILAHENTLFVADPGSGSVVQFTLPGNAKKFAASGLVNPLSLSMSPNGGSLFIADSGRGIVVEAPLTPGGTQSDRVSNPELQGPNGVIVDRNGQIWVADMSAMAIFKFSPTGTLLTTLRPGGGI